VSQTGVVALHPAVDVHVLQVPWSHIPLHVVAHDGESEAESLPFDASGRSASARAAAASSPEPTPAS
jgi:hypothetical protein